MPTTCPRPAGAMALALATIATAACTSASTANKASQHKALFVANND